MRVASNNLFAGVRPQKAPAGAASNRAFQAFSAKPPAMPVDIYLPEKRKGGESNGIENHTEATDENQIHLQISQQIFLGKFVEPKRRYLAQNCYFDVKVEPFWLNNEACPNGKRSVFGIVQRRNSLKLQHLRVAYYYALWDLSYGITSRDFVCHKSPPHSRNRLTL